jgi:chemotaxis protein methyltransferase CheR
MVADGYYIMGKTEYLGRQVEDLFVAKNTAQKIFMKRDKPLVAKTP